MLLQYPQFVRTKAAFSMYGKDVTLETFRFPVEKAGDVEDDFLLFGSKVHPVVVLPITKSGQLVVLEHYRYATRTVVWELPGGTEHDTPDEETAIQELRAETGYAAACIQPLKSRRSIWFDPASCKVGFVPMLAIACVHVGPPVRVRNEFFEPRELELTEWLRMIFEGEVVDSKSIVTTMLALPKLPPDLRSAAKDKLSSLMVV